MLSALLSALLRALLSALLSALRVDGEQVKDAADNAKSPGRAQELGELLMELQQALLPRDGAAERYFHQASTGTAPPWSRTARPLFVWRYEARAGKLPAPPALIAGPGHAA